LLKRILGILVDWSGGWATPWGSAIEERKSTTRYCDEPLI